MIIENYIENIIDARVRELILASDILIQSLLPQIILELKWKVPYYSYFGKMCYLNVSKGKFYIAFFNNKKLLHHANMDHSMKMVSKLYIDDMEKLNKAYVSELIVEVAMMNELSKSKKKG